MAPRRCGADPGERGELGQPVERQVHLARRAAIAIAPQVVGELGRHVLERRPGDRRSVSGRGSTSTTRASSSSPFSSTTPCARPSRTRIRDTPASVRISTPACARRRGDGVRDGAGAALRQSPGAEGAVDLAHVVVQQHVGRPRRSHAEERADDARRGHRRLEHVGLEPAIEEVHRAHRQEPQVRRLLAVAQRAEAPSHAEQVGSPRGSSDVGSGGVIAEDRLDEPRHLDHRHRHSRRRHRRRARE